MAKKPVESGAPETPATKKAAVRKTAVKKTAATGKAAAKSDKKTAAAAPVEALAAKTGANKAKEPAKAALKTKAAKPAKKTADKPAAAPAPAPVKAAAPAEQAPAPVVQPKPVVENTSPMTVRRESFRPRRSPDQQHERREQNGGDVFAQPETVGGAGENPFNKRKRRRRNKKGNGGGGEDRQPAQDNTFASKHLDGKKVAARAWKMFLAEVSEEGLALMDDQTAREAARRAFRCAEFFMMEEVRRKNIQKSSAQQDKPLAQDDERDSDEDSGEE